MSFAFNFSGDDIESSDNDLDGATEQVNDLSLDAEAKREDGEQVRVIPLDELVSMTVVSVPCSRVVHWPTEALKNLRNRELLQFNRNSGGDMPT